MSGEQQPTIKDFLLARIAEDEATARASIATQAPDEWENPTSVGNYYPADIVFWDHLTPARVLTECTAKRAIVYEHGVNVHGDLCKVCSENDRVDGTGYATPMDYPCRTLRALAAVYSDHPGYRQEWALDG